MELEDQLYREFKEYKNNFIIFKENIDTFFKILYELPEKTKKEEFPVEFKKTIENNKNILFKNLNFDNLNNKIKDNFEDFTFEVNKKQNTKQNGIILLYERINQKPLLINFKIIGLIKTYLKNFPEYIKIKTVNDDKITRITIALKNDDNISIDKINLKKLKIFDKIPKIYIIDYNYEDFTINNKIQNISILINPNISK